MRALIVEDDPASQMYFRDTLQALGWDCQIAEDGSKGVEMFQSYVPDLVLLDLNLPKINGIQVLEKIREDSDAIVIIVTAHGSEEHAVQALRLRANNYLSKPVDQKILVSLLAKYKQTVELKIDQSERPGAILKKSATFKFPPQMGVASKAASQLMDEAGGIFDKATHSQIQLGLNEILTNSIEYGCLGISDEDKAIAYLEGHEAYQKLLQERMKQAVMKEKQVIVDLRVDDSCIEWTIQDSGEGFDWEGEVRKGEGSAPSDNQGRGLYLCQFAFDKMEFMGSGNIVRVIKHRN